MLISFLFPDENICCGYSLEAPRRGASNGFPQHMFLSRNKKKILCGYPILSVAMQIMGRFLWGFGVCICILCHKDPFLALGIKYYKYVHLAEFRQKLSVPR